MTFDREYFQQFFGILMGTNLAPILANLYLAMLQEEVKEKCGHDLKLKWPEFFLRFSRRWFRNYGSLEKRCRILDKPIQWYKKNNQYR